MMSWYRGDEFGYEEGEVCGRNGCKGVIHLPKVEGCTCFKNAQCGACTSNYFTCPVCGWTCDEYEKGEEMEAEMNKAEKIFDIGDLVIRRTDMIDIATGARKSTYQGVTRKVIEITESESGFEYRTRAVDKNASSHCLDDKEKYLMHAEVAPAAAISWLADRMTKVAAMAV